MSDQDVSDQDKQGGDKSVQAKIAVAPKKKKEDDKSPGIIEKEFCNINFDLDWPRIVQDLEFYLTGADKLSGPMIIEEKDPHTAQEELCKD